MNWRPLIIVFMGLCLALTASPGQAKDSEATGEVKTVLEKAMDIQTRPDLEGDAHLKQRGKLVRELISEHFLSREMAKESLSEVWEKISAQQRSEFEGLFTRLFQDSYTRLVLNFLKRESIEYTGETDKGSGVEVKTVIMRANEHIPVDYLVVRTGGHWRIRDVIIDGVSIVENYKNSFSRVIRTGSFNTLLEKMRLQNKAIRDDVA